MMISDLEGNGYCKPFYVCYEKKENKSSSKWNVTLVEKEYKFNLNERRRIHI